MAFNRLDTEPSCQAFDRIRGERWLDDFSHQSRIECPRVAVAETGSLAFAIKDRQVKANIVADDHGPADEIDECRPNIREPGCSSYLDVIDVMDCRGR